MSSEIPFQFRLPKRRLLKLNVPKKRVNVFLSILWDSLTETIGRMGCLHHYLPTDKPEIYIYKVDWSDVSLTFDAQINFFNHTSKGITKIDLAVVDRKTGEEDKEITKKVLDIIIKTQEESLHERAKAPSGIALVPVITSKPLNGYYDLVECSIFPSNGSAEISNGGERFLSFLEFFVFEKSQQEKLAEAIEKSRIMTAGLSLLTQNLFIADFANITFSTYSTEYNDEETSEKGAAGQFILDDGLIVDQLQANEEGVFVFIDDQSITKDIVEPRDVIINGTIALPVRVNQAIHYILDNKNNLMQATFRFQEGLIFQQEMIYYPGNRSLGDMLTPYQLIAFVAAIEALLDTSPIDMVFPCPSCSHAITVKERQINKAFLSFVSTQSGGNPVFEKIFKEIYNDRSKFVHTGKDLYNRTAIRPNRPLILDGKNILAYKPQYQFNMPDYVGWLIRRYIYRSMLGIQLS